MRKKKKENGVGGGGGEEEEEGLGDEYEEVWDGSEPIEEEKVQRERQIGRNANCSSFPTLIPYQGFPKSRSYLSRKWVGGIGGGGDPVLNIQKQTHLLRCPLPMFSAIPWLFRRHIWIRLGEQNDHRKEKKERQHTLTKGGHVPRSPARIHVTGAKNFQRLRNEIYQSRSKTSLRSLFIASSSLVEFFGNQRRYFLNFDKVQLWFVGVSIKRRKRCKL